MVFEDRDPPSYVNDHLLPNVYSFKGFDAFMHDDERRPLTDFNHFNKMDRWATCVRSSIHLRHHATSMLTEMFD